MMLRDCSADHLRQPVFVRQLFAGAHMVNDDARTRVRIQAVMWVHCFNLVFYKVFGAHGLADVMKHCADAHQQRVRADLLRCVLGKIGNLQAVLIAARRCTQQLQKQRVIRARKLHQLQGGGDVKHVAQQEQPQQCQRARDQAVGKAGAQ